MPNTATSDSTEVAVRRVVEDFLNTLLEEKSEHFVRNLIINRDSFESRDFDQTPEAFTEQFLIYELLDSLGFRYKKQSAAFGGSGEHYPDFRLKDTDDIGVIGENKPVNEWNEAPPQVDHYLDKKSVGAEYGIATDGIVWSLHRFNEGSDKEKAQRRERIDLQPVFLDVARDMGIIPPDHEPEFADPSEKLEKFTEWFQADNFQGKISSEIPKWIREEQKEGVDEFFDLFIQLIFGEGDDKEYTTSLVDEIIPPPEGASDEEKNIFSVVLANRLIFIKLLEEYNIIRSGFLFKRLKEYENHKGETTGNFYDAHLRPLFYSLLNTHPKKRSGKHKSGWFSDVPYLNGGLFRESVENEYQYSVSDYILKRIIRDLIEGHRLQEQSGQNQIDPSILGKVFEKTITYLEHDRDKKDVGAYYTPTDVTRLIISQTLDRKVKDILVETFASHATPPTEAVEESMREDSLEKILRDIEQGEGWFGDTNGLADAEEKILNLKTVDPACGSGHFLTSLMTGIYRVWEAIYRGRHGRENPGEKEVYEARKQIALQAVYGVDINPIAVEIAKLRLWLKVIEGIEWERSFGPLPNIDMNITTGNALVGLPVQRSNGLPFWGDDVEKLASLREEHKYDPEGRKKDIIDVQEESIKPRYNEAFINQFNEKHEWEPSSHEEFKAFMDSLSISDFSNIFSNQHIRIENDGNDPLSEKQKNFLENKEFTLHKWVAKLRFKDLVDGFVVDNEIDRIDAKSKAYEWVKSIGKNNLTLQSVERRPAEYDISNIQSEPLHWSVIFPELTNNGTDDHNIQFDVIVGNPPYGDILNNSERLFANYNLVGYNQDVSTPFVERQCHLLSEGGYFGNITTARLVYNEKTHRLHNFLRHQLEDVHFSSFGSRPSRIFKNADIRTSIITGKKKTTENKSPIYTSEFILFTDDDRDERMRSIKHERSDDLYLGRRVGDFEGTKSRWLPKIGSAKIRKILDNLSDFGKTFDDLRCEDARHTLLWTEGNRHWIPAMLSKTYESTEFFTISFHSDLHKRYAFLVLHSHLFYLYWMVYADQYHLNKGTVRKFPILDPQKIQSKRKFIIHYSNFIWDEMNKNFHGDHYKISPIRKHLPEIDEHISSLYGLDNNQIDFIKKYNMKYRSNQ